MRATIEAKALEVLFTCGIPLSNTLETNPISLRTIFARYPHLILRFTDLSPTTDGAYVRNERAHAIYINRKRPYVRRRFSLAHEFGHYILGHPSSTSTFGSRNHWTEVQANQFAAFLLMPRELVKLLNRRMCSIAEIALWFRVSELAMAIRMDELGLRAFETRLVRFRYQRLRQSLPARKGGEKWLQERIIRDLRSLDFETRARVIRAFLPLQGKECAKD